MKKLNPGSINRRQGLWGGFGLPRPGWRELQSGCNCLWSLPFCRWNYCLQIIHSGFCRWIDKSKPLYLYRKFFHSLFLFRVSSVSRRKSGDLFLFPNTSQQKWICPSKLLPLEQIYRIFTRYKFLVYHHAYTDHRHRRFHRFFSRRSLSQTRTPNLRNRLHQRLLRRQPKKNTSGKRRELNFVK